MDSAALTAALGKFEGLYPETIELSLGRIEAVLDTLGRPQDKLPPTIHVAGTNGKGSTCAYLRAMAEEAGLRVHVYTSPHLVRFNERIVIAGQEIKDAALIDALERTDAAMGDAMLTYFETTTCAALLAFSETPADYAIIEVGLGGRLDATNVFDDVAADFELQLHDIAAINSRPTSIRRISDVPAPISISLASRKIRATGASLRKPAPPIACTA